MRIIRSRAGFLDADGMNYNPRTKFQVPDELRSQVFPWLKSARASFMSTIDTSTGEPVSKSKITAYKFLEFLDQLQDVVIQDAAAILIDYPSRGHHGIFSLPIFRSKLFHDYKLALQRKLATSKAPWDSSIESVLPGINSNFIGMRSAMDDLKDDIKNVKNDTQFLLNTYCSQRLEGMIQEMPRRNAATMCRFLSTGFSAAATEAVEHAGDCEDDPVEATPTATPTTSPVKFVPPPTTAKFPGDGYQLPLKPASATEIWSAWFGVGRYDGIPVSGGIEALEVQHKSKWRKNQSVKEKKHFYRWKAAVTLMREQFGDRDAETELDSFLAEMDVVFENAGNFSPFVDKELPKRSNKAKKPRKKRTKTKKTVAEGLSAPIVGVDVGVGASSNEGDAQDI